MKSFGNGDSALIALYRSLRNARGSRFMFIPPSLSFTEMCTLVSLEYRNTKLGDAMLLECAARDLKARGLLPDVPFTTYAYELGSDTFHDVYATTADGQRFCRGTSRAGAMEAYAKALGEVFERTALKFNLGETVVATEREMITRFGAESVVGPSRFPRPTRIQRERSPQDIVGPSDALSWNQAERIGGVRPVWIPSQACFFWNHSRFPDEKIMLQPTTHGAAGGFGKEEAIRAGILEIIHRHYFLQSWYQGTIPKRLSLSNSTEPIADLIRQIEAHGFKATILDYSAQARVPSVICFLSRDGGYFVGGSASSTLSDAVERAITEAFSTYTWYAQATYAGQNDVSPELIASISNDFTDVKAGDDPHRVMLYADRFFNESGKSYDLGRFLSGEFTQFETVAREFDIVDPASIERIARESFGEIYVFESDKPYLRAYGYHAVKTIVPDSYYFALHERHSRPVLSDSVEPRMTIINPFP